MPQPCALTTAASSAADADVGQGFGNVGATVARLLHEMGAVVVAVSDSQDGIYNPGGLRPDAVAMHRQRYSTLQGFAEADMVSNPELFELPCEILVPSATQGQITARNAPLIKACILAEAANGPTSPEADRILYDQGCFVLPDILANAGGVTVSYFEWVQGLQEFFWSEREVNTQLERIMSSAFQSVLSMAKERRVDMRTAAYLLGVQRVADAVTTRGIYP